MKNLRVVFMGTSLFSLEVLKELIHKTNVVLIVSQPDKKVGRKDTLTPSIVKQMGIDAGIEVFTPVKLKEDYKKVIDAKPDIIITCAYGQIVPKELLDYPKYKAINVHASLLPKLRGGAPIQRAIIEGYKETGITIMYMNASLDSGDIISQEKVTIDKEDTYDTLSNKLCSVGTKLLIETLPKIIDGTNDRIVQNEEEVTYAKVISKEDELINFNDTGVNIINKIRGLNSNPGAYFTLDEKVYKVYEAHLGEKETNMGIINNIYKDGIGIGSLDKEVIITKIKPAGKNIMNVSDYLNGIKKENLLGAKVNDR